MKALTLAFLGLLLFSACASTDSSNSDNVKQDEVWQNYWVEYNEVGNEFKGGATFRFGGKTGTTLLLTAPSNVTLNGKALSSSSGVLIEGVIGGTHYSTEGTGFKPEYTFVYTNNEGKLFTNSIGIEKCNVEEVPDVLDATKTNIFVFKSAPEAAGEHLEVEVRNDKNNWVVIDNPVVNGNTVSIDGAVLAELGNGPVSVLFRKQKGNSLKEAGHLGGAIAITYNSKQYRSKLVNVPKAEKNSNDKTIDTLVNFDH